MRMGNACVYELVWHSVHTSLCVWQVAFVLGAFNSFFSFSGGGRVWSRGSDPVGGWVWGVCMLASVLRYPKNGVFGMDISWSMCV